MKVSDVLGIPSELSLEERQRLVALRRTIPKKVLKPAKVCKSSEVYQFPHDIWFIVFKYLCTLGILKLEKTCRYMYSHFNRECGTCDNELLRMREGCKSIWLKQYVLIGQPFKSNQLFEGASCRVLKALVSRKILIEIAPNKLLELR